MVDITAKLFWYRTKEWYRVMADKVNDIVYTDEKKETVDVINLLLLGWILLGLIVYIIGNIVATHLRKRKSTLAARRSETADETSQITKHVSCAPEEEIKSEDVVVSEKLTLSHEIPTCEGDDAEIVEWINNVFSWIYNQRVISPVIDAWLSALNARTRLSSTEHGILVHFKDANHSSGPPKITDALQSSNSKSEASITCDTEIENITFDIIVTQFKEKEKVTVPYVLNVKRLAGKAYIECMPEDVTFYAKYSEVPQVQLSTEPIQNHPIPTDELQPLNDLVCEIATEALSSSLVNLRFTCFPDCPRLSQKSYSEDAVLDAEEVKSVKHLLVKIIKASNLGGSQGCLKPYCVVEMDEPPQRFETQTVEDKHNPFWDESYTFTVKDISAELLFEIYDKEKPSTENFLGLGIVSIDELLRNPSQRQIIPLQSRPMENDDVTGSLTAEFLFLNQVSPVSETTHLSQVNTRSEESSEPGKFVETNCRVTAGGTVITTTTIKRTNEESSHTPEATSNLHSNNILTSSGEHNLTPMHEAKETFIDEGKVVNELNSQVMNGGSKISNGSLSNDHKISNLLKLYQNKMPEQCEQTEFINEKEPPILEVTKETVIEDECSIEENKELVSNGVPTIASPTLHVHEFSKLPLIVVDDDSGNIKVEHLSQFNEDQNIDSNEANSLHDNALNLENNEFDLKDVTENGIDLSSDLPPIAEIIEVNSTPPESLENTDTETDLTGAALKEIEKLSKPNATSKSTLIIHSVQRVSKDKSGEWQEFREPDTSVSESLEASPASHISKDSRTSYSESVPSSPSQDRSLNRSRPKEKKSFMGTLRRRLSFHKTRSKSAENRSEAVSTYSQASSRSASTDRIRHPSNQKYSPFKERLLGQFLHVPGSTRSSLSEASGISGISTRTYINENSTLVIETNENGIIKRYLIPNSVVHQSKWKKRGVKLHIYNDHVFVAKHLSGSTLCQVCQKYLTRRPGKQGYECRGCNLQCHKSCHVKVENFCSNSSINSMEVEYIHDPKGASPKSI